MPFARDKNYVSVSNGSTLQGILLHSRGADRDRVTGLHTSFLGEAVDELAPHKDGHGNRYYTEADIEFIKQVKYLRDEMKITRIEAIRAELKKNNKQIDIRQRTAELLSSVRAELAEIRSMI